MKKIVILVLVLIVTYACSNTKGVSTFKADFYVSTKDLIAGLEL